MGCGVKSTSRTREVKAIGNTTVSAGIHRLTRAGRLLLQNAVAIDIQRIHASAIPDCDSRFGFANK